MTLGQDYREGRWLNWRDPMKSDMRGQKPDSGPLRTKCERTRVAIDIGVVGREKQRAMLVLVLKLFMVGWLLTTKRNYRGKRLLMMLGW